jgi:hypothetical protein
MTEEERQEKLAMIQAHQMRIVELQKIEDPEERNAAYEALPEFTLTSEEIHEIYQG